MKKLLLIIGLFLLCSVFGIAQNNTSGELKTGYLEIGKAKIYYEEKGTGTPFIMIHGGFIDRRMWDEQFEYFSKDYRVIRYDVRNHGSTTSEADTYTDYDDLNKIMESLKIDKAIVMGLSMGGYIAIDFALTHPEKVIAILPVATGLSGFKAKDEEWLAFDKKINEAFEKDDIESAAEVMLHYWTDGPLRTPEQVDKTMREKIKTMLVGTYKKWDINVRVQRLNPPAVDRLSEIKIPTLTIYGDLDLQGIKDIAGKLEKEILGSKKFMIKGTAHMLNMEFPKEFNEIVEKFLNELKFNVSTEEVEKMVKENIGNTDFVLLDVRTAEEFETEHFTGAINLDIKLSDFSDKLSTLDKNKSYLVYCKGGGRSAKAVDYMRKIGFEKAYNMAGGIMKWKKENRSLDIK